jgi:hypothetical protein
VVNDDGQDSDLDGSGGDSGDDDRGGKDDAEATKPDERGSTDPPAAGGSNDEPTRSAVAEPPLAEAALTFEEAVMGARVRVLRDPAAVAAAQDAAELEWLDSSNHRCGTSGQVVDADDSDETVQVVFAADGEDMWFHVSALTAEPAAAATADATDVTRVGDATVLNNDGDGDGDGDGDSNNDGDDDDNDDDDDGQAGKLDSGSKDSTAAAELENLPAAASASGSGGEPERSTASSRPPPVSPQSPEVALTFDEAVVGARVRLLRDPAAVAAAQDAAELEWLDSSNVRCGTGGKVVDADDSDETVQVLFDSDGEDMWFHVSALTMEPRVVTAKGGDGDVTAVEDATVDKHGQYNDDDDSKSDEAEGDRSAAAAGEEPIARPAGDKPMAAMQEVPLAFEHAAVGARVRLLRDPAAVAAAQDAAELEWLDSSNVRCGTGGKVVDADDADETVQVLFDSDGDDMWFHVSALTAEPPVVPATAVDGDKRRVEDAAALTDDDNDHDRDDQDDHGDDGDDDKSVVNDVARRTPAAATATGIGGASAADDGEGDDGEGEAADPAAPEAEVALTFEQVVIGARVQVLSDPAAVGEAQDVAEMEWESSSHHRCGTVGKVVDVDDEDETVQVAFAADGEDMWLHVSALTAKRVVVVVADKPGQANNNKPAAADGIKDAGKAPPAAQQQLKAKEKEKVKAAPAAAAARVDDGGGGDDDDEEEEEPDPRASNYFAFKFRKAFKKKMRAICERFSQQREQQHQKKPLRSTARVLHSKTDSPPPTNTRRGGGGDDDDQDGRESESDD